MENFPLISNKLIILKDHYENLQGNLYKTRSLQVISLFREPWKLELHSPQALGFHKWCASTERSSAIVRPHEITWNHHVVGCLIPRCSWWNPPIFDGSGPHGWHGQVALGWMLVIHPILTANLYNLFIELELQWNTMFMNYHSINYIYVIPFYDEAMNLFH